MLSGCGPGWKVLKASNPTTLGAANNVAVSFDSWADLMAEEAQDPEHDGPEDEVRGERVLGELERCLPAPGAKPR